MDILYSKKWLSSSSCCFLEEATICKTGKAFCLRVLCVLKNILGIWHIWVKMGSDERHFNVSLTVWNKVTRQCPQTTPFLKRKESQSGIEPRPFCSPALRLTSLTLSQTGSRKRSDELMLNVLRCHLTY